MLRMSNMPRHRLDNRSCTRNKAIKHHTLINFKISGHELRGFSRIRKCRLWVGIWYQLLLTLCLLLEWKDSMRYSLLLNEWVEFRIQLLSSAVLACVVLTRGDG